MPQIGERSTDGKGKTFCGWALYCPLEDFTHDPWPTWAQAQTHIEFTQSEEGSWSCSSSDHEVVEVWKQGRAGVELGDHYPSSVEIADLAAWAMTLLDNSNDPYTSEGQAA